MSATRIEHETKDADDNPAFGRLTELYEWLGLDTDQAAEAADADLACGWQSAGIPTES
jgi:hypothetical protein